MSEKNENISKENEIKRKEIALKFNAILKFIKKEITLGHTQTKISSDTNVLASLISKIKKLNIEIGLEVPISTAEDAISIINNHYNLAVSEYENFKGEIDYIVKLNDEPEGEKEYYVYHYIDRLFEPAKGLLILYPKKGKKKRKVELKTYKKGRQGKSEEDTIYSGSIIEGEKLVILFTEERKGELKSNRSTPSLCSFEEETDGVSIGVFCNSGDMISCGIVVIEPIHTDEIEELIHNTDVRPEIQAIIHNAKFVPHYKEEQGVILRKQKILETTKEIKGVYEAYSLINTNVINANVLIRKLPMEFFEDGKVRFKSASHTNGEWARVVDVRKGRNLVIQSRLSKEHHYYKIQMVFELQKAKVLGVCADCFIGVFSGIEQGNENPMGGRIIIFRRDDISFEDLTVEVLRPEECMKNGNSQTDKANILRRFFRGELDTFLDNPQIIENPVLRTQNNLFSSLYGFANNLKPLSSAKREFKGYYCGHRGNSGIREFTLDIDFSDKQDIRVVEKGFHADSNNYHGSASFSNRILFVYLVNTLGEAISFVIYSGNVAHYHGEITPDTPKIICGSYHGVSRNGAGINVGELVLVRKDAEEEVDKNMLHRYLKWQPRSFQLKGDISYKVSDLKLRKKHELDILDNLVGTYRIWGYTRHKKIIQSKFVLEDNYEAFLYSVIATKDGGKQECSLEISEFDTQKRLCIAAKKQGNPDLGNYTIIEFPDSSTYSKTKSNGNLENSQEGEESKQDSTLYLDASHSSIGNKRGIYASFVIFMLEKEDNSPELTIGELSEHQLKTLLEIPRYKKLKAKLDDLILRNNRMDTE